MTGDAWEEYRDGEISLDTLQSRVENPPISQRTYGYIPVLGWEVKEWHAFAINKIGLALLIVAFLMMGPAVVDDYKAKKALESDLEEMGCDAIFKHSGNFSIEGQASEEELLNIYNQSRITPVPPPAD